MTTFERIQRQIWDSLMDHERRVFLQLIQDELPSLTLRELGEILTSPAARSVGALPVSSLLTGVAPSAPAPAVKPSRRAVSRVAPAEKSGESTTAAPGPRLRPVAARSAAVDSTSRPSALNSTSSRPSGLNFPSQLSEPELAPPSEPEVAPQSPISAHAVEVAQVANIRPVSVEVAPAAARRPAAPLQLEIAPAPDRSNVDVVRSAVSRTLAQHGRFDSDTLVLNALRSTGEWIRARDLRPRVGLQPDDLRAVLNRLVKTGAVRREGEGPDTVYQVVPAPTSAAN